MLIRYIFDAINMDGGTWNMPVVINEHYLKYIGKHGVIKCKDGKGDEEIRNK